MHGTAKSVSHLCVLLLLQFYVLYTVSYVHVTCLTEVVTYHIDNIYKGLSQIQFLSNPLCFDLSTVKRTALLLQSSLRRIF